MARPTLAEAAQRKSLLKYARSMSEFVLPDQSWLIENVIPSQSLTLIYAQTGHQKSLLSLDVARSLAQGKEWLKQTTLKSRVLYIDGEMSQRNIATRVQSMQINNIPRSDLTYLATSLIDDFEFDLRSPECRQQLIHDLKNNDYEVVVLDNIRTLLNVESENSASEYSTFNNLIKQIRGLGISVIVVHHSNKTTNDDGEASYAGSSNIATVYDTILSLTADPDNNLTISVKKARDQEVKDFMDNLVVTYVAPNGYAQLTTAMIKETAQLDRIKVAQAIMSCLQMSPGTTRSSKKLFSLVRDRGHDVSTPKRLGWESIYNDYIEDTLPAYDTFKKFETDRKKWLKQYNEQLIKESDDFIL